MTLTSGAFVNKKRNKQTSHELQNNLDSSCISFCISSRKRQFKTSQDDTKLCQLQLSVKIKFPDAASIFRMTIVTIFSDGQFTKFLPMVLRCARFARGNSAMTLKNYMTSSDLYPSLAIAWLSREYKGEEKSLGKRKGETAKGDPFYLLAVQIPPPPSPSPSLLCQVRAKIYVCLLFV